MTTASTAPARCRFAALGTTAELLVTDPAALPDAERMLRRQLDELDVACSRFRPDSEISRLHAGAGTAVSVGPLLFEALTVAVRAAVVTGGLVDPTVGRAVAVLGYDRDFAEIARDDPGPVVPAGPAPGWWRIRLDPARRQVLLPRGVWLDLGATAKAFAADRAAAALAAAGACGALVALGGDIATAGPAPADGWALILGDDHAHTDPHHDPTITITAGSVATSSTTVRAWRRGGRDVHHVIDARTGDIPAPVWRTASVAAGSCLDANTAATAALLLGAGGPAWLAARRLPARLVGVGGAITTVAGWPHDEALR